MIFFQKTATSKFGAAVRCLQQTPANLHCDRIHAARLATQLLAKTRADPGWQCWPLAGHVHPGVQRHGVPRAPQLHPP
jgi:hypothetical protein